MPAIIDRITVGKKHDKRIKLTDEQRQEIRDLYPSLSQRRLAEMYGVSRRLVQFVLDPEKVERNKAVRAERGGWRQYYDPVKQREYMRAHRARKKELLDKQKIGV